jgi:hypothetical protein
MFFTEMWTRLPSFLSVMFPGSPVYDAFLCPGPSLLLEVSRSCSPVLLLLEFIPRACCSTGHIPPFCRYRLAIDLFLRDELCLP